jgi:hypothetical protein
MQHACMRLLRQGLQALLGFVFASRGQQKISPAQHSPAGVKCVRAASYKIGPVKSEDFDRL